MESETLRDFIIYFTNYNYTFDKTVNNNKKQHSKNQIK